MLYNVTQKNKNKNLKFKSLKTERKNEKMNNFIKKYILGMHENETYYFRKKKLNKNVNFKKIQIF